MLVYYPGLSSLKGTEHMANELVALLLYLYAQSAQALTWLDACMITQLGSEPVKCTCVTIEIWMICSPALSMRIICTRSHFYS